MKATNPEIRLMRANEKRIKAGLGGGVPCQTKRTIIQLSTVVISPANKVLPKVKVDSPML